VKKLAVGWTETSYRAFCQTRRSLGTSSLRRNFARGTLRPATRQILITILPAHWIITLPYLTILREGGSANGPH
jgi:hypothetical protein